MIITLFAEEIEEAVMQYLVKTHGLNYDALSLATIKIQDAHDTRTKAKDCTVIVSNYVNVNVKKEKQ